MFVCVYVYVCVYIVYVLCVCMCVCADDFFLNSTSHTFQELAGANARLAEAIEAQRLTEGKQARYREKCQTYLNDIGTHWLLPLFRKTPATAAKYAPLCLWPGAGAPSFCVRACVASV